MSVLYYFWLFLPFGVPIFAALAVYRPLPTEPFQDRSGKYFHLVGVDLQVFGCFGDFFLKKYLVGMEKGCTFAAVFVQNGTREI